jgi:hypothetical protein
MLVAACHQSPARPRAASSGGPTTGRTSTAAPSVPATTKAPAAGSAPAVGGGPWTSIAPGQVSTDFNSPPAGNYGFNTIVVDPTNPSVLFMGTNYQGLWKSTDQGATWVKINTGAGGDLLDQGRLWTLAIDPFNHNTLWTTSGYGAGGPLRSIDGGVSWSLLSVGAPIQNNDVYSIALDPYTPGHLLLAYHYAWTTDGTNSGVSESTDGGATWINHQPPAGSNWGAGNTVAFLNNSHTWLLGSQTGGIWRTVSSGASWTQVLGDPITHGGVNSLVSAGGALYLAHSTSVSKSSDNGVTWTDITSGLPDHTYETVVSDGTNLYTAPSFPIQNNVDGPWYYRPIAGGTWQPYGSQHTCYNGNCNGPVMGAYDPVNHIAYAVNWLGGVWKHQGRT